MRYAEERGGNGRSGAGGGGAEGARIPVDDPEAAEKEPRLLVVPDELGGGGRMGGRGWPTPTRSGIKDAEEDLTIRHRRRQQRKQTKRKVSAKKHKQKQMH